MSIEVIYQSVQKARKEYADDAWDFIHEWMNEGCPVYKGKSYERGHLTMAEARFLVKVRRRDIMPYRIEIGQLYRSQFNKYEGKTYTWRAKEEFYQLCCKYDLWEDL